MEYAFEAWQRLGPAAFVLRAILAAIVADGLLLVFIMFRRTYRKWHFARRDARMFEYRQNWDSLISGEIPYTTWRTKPYQRRIVQTMALDALEAAGTAESARLLSFLRGSGLVEKLIFDARTHHGWRRLRALVALGQSRAPEGIPALGEGLRDRNAEAKLAALRGLGRMASPQAAEEILGWLAESGLAVPALPVQSALLHCCAERPQILLPHLQHAQGPVREVLGRVLGEIATPSLGAQLLEFVDDDQDELRAAAARGFAHAEPGLAVQVLSDLVEDPVWFVRLRAIVSLGKLRHPGAIPSLLRGLTDSNRLVRLRAAEGLVDFKTESVPILEKIVATRDRYGLHAYLTAIENAGLMSQLAADIETDQRVSQITRRMLAEVLHGASLPMGQAPAKTVPAGIASRP